MSMDSHGLASDHGHLPSNGMERTISAFVDGIEDEDGRTCPMFRHDDEDMPVVRPKKAPASGAKCVLEDAKKHYAMFALQQKAELERRKLAAQRQTMVVKPADQQDEDEDEEDEDDEEFMRYKMERLKQMQQAAKATAMLPTFGHLECVDVLEYPGMVDNVGNDRTFVVVALHEDYLPASVRLKFKLEAIAAKYDQVRFISVCAHDANEELSDEVLPILLVYQAKEYVNSEDRVGHTQGARLTEGHVEELLMHMGVRLTAASAMRDADAAALQRMRELGYDEPNREGEEEDDGEESD